MAPLVLSSALPPNPGKIVEAVCAGVFVDFKDLLLDNVALRQRIADTSILGSQANHALRMQEVGDVETWIHCFLAFVAAKVDNPLTRELWPMAIGGGRAPPPVDRAERLHDGCRCVPDRRYGNSFQRQLGVKVRAGKGQCGADIFYKKNCGKFDYHERIALILETPNMPPEGIELATKWTTQLKADPEIDNNDKASNIEKENKYPSLDKSFKTSIEYQEPMKKKPAFSRSCHCPSCRGFDVTSAEKVVDHTKTEGCKVANIYKFTRKSWQGLG
uniref:Uncharacterized protein n=1 Tax=Amphimedon queenslandica TaxID=400682 RepID=A0A1X7UK34_AMPQE